MKMSSSRVLLGILLLIILVGSGLIIWMRRGANTSSSSTESSQFVSSAKYEIVHQTLSTPPADLYILNGEFIRELFYENDVLMGDFVIAGDTGSSPIRILFTTNEGNFNLGRTSSEGIRWDVVPQSELLSAIKPNNRVEIRLVQYADSPDASAVRAEIEKLSTDNRIEPLEYGFVAYMVRNLNE
jgi:hypothetical protein